MYNHPVTVIQSIAGCGFAHFRDFKLKSNGVHVRDEVGQIVTSGYRNGFADSQFWYTFQNDGMLDHIEGPVKDPILSKRITKYLAEFHMEKRTNCSAFAHYLATGKFVECGVSNSNFVLEGNMTTYNQQKINVGDMVCVIFYGSICNTRREINPVRNIYKRNRKSHHAGNDMLEMCATKHTRTFSPSNLRRLVGGLVYETFHFMSCIAHHNGQPIFIQQCGRNWDIGKGNSPAIVFSISGYGQIYNEHTPAIVLIQRKKNRTVHTT